MEALMYVILAIFYLALIGFSIAVQWKIFTKANEPGWACLIPIYNILVMLKIIGKPWWWLIMLLIPGVNLIFGIWAANMLSKSFGKDESFTIGLVLLNIIFLAILAFGDAVYQGPFGNKEEFDAYQQRLRGGDLTFATSL